MKPWQHARSSASRLGCPDAWADHVPIHTFIDQSKAACADWCHRMLLHHVDFGVPLAVAAFARSGHDPGAVQRILAEHVQEDVGFPAKLSDWLSLLQEKLLPLPRPARDRADEEADLTAHWRLADQAFVAEILDFFDAPSKLAGCLLREQAAAALHHSFGPFLAEAFLGPGREVATTDGGLRFVGTRDVAEVVVAMRMGRIPQFARVASALARPKWMET